jgi:hypothetical protein
MKWGAGRRERGEGRREQGAGRINKNNLLNTVS